MLFSPEDPRTPIENIPVSRAANFKTWCSRLTEAEKSKIRTWINNKIGASDVFCSSWLPGAEWDADIETIYTKACLLNEEAAAKCFGLFVWETMINRTDEWSFTRMEGENAPEGMTYFRR